jgi:hypothetical protein
MGHSFCIVTVDSFHMVSLLFAGSSVGYYMMMSDRLEW